MARRESRRDALRQIVAALALVGSLLLLALPCALAAPLPSPPPGGAPSPSASSAPSTYASPKRPSRPTKSSRPKPPPKPGSREAIFSTPPQVVDLRADKVTQIGNRTIAEGHAIAITDGMMVSGDRLEVDFDRHVLEARGHVRMFQGGDEVHASKATYDLITKVADLDDVFGIARNLALQNQPLQSEVYFWGQRMKWDGRTMVLTKAALTTCDVPSPRWHYHTTGDTITIYPEDRVEVRKARLFLGKRQVAGRSRLVFNLRERNRDLIPRIGYDSTNGWFLKETLGYSLGGDQRGLLHLDYYQKNGPGLGFEHFYKLGNRGTGQLYFYDVPGTGKGESRYNLRSHTDYTLMPKFQATLDVFAGAMTGASEKLNSPATTSIYLSLLQYGDRHIVYQNFGYYTSTTGASSNTYNLILKNTLTDQLSNDLEALYQQTSVGAYNSYFFRAFDRLTWHGDLFDSDLSWEKTSGTNTLYLVNRTPEFTMRTRQMHVGPVPVRFVVGASQVQELPAGNRAWRGDLQVSVPDFVLPIGDRGSLNLGVGLRQMFYDNGDAQYLKLARANYQQDIGEDFRTRLDYRYSRATGYTPLQTDFFPRYNSLSAGLEFQKQDLFRFGVYAGRDFDFSRYYNLETRLRVTPARGWGFDVGSTYDVDFGRLSNVDSIVRIPLSKSLSVQHYMLYDVQNRRLTYQDFMIQDEGHDWVTSLVYRSVQNQFMLQVGLKAFPFEIPTVGPNQHNPVLPIQQTRSLFH